MIAPIKKTGALPRRGMHPKICCYMTVLLLLLFVEKFVQVGLKTQHHLIPARTRLPALKFQMKLDISPVLCLCPPILLIEFLDPGWRKIFQPDSLRVIGVLYHKRPQSTLG